MSTLSKTEEKILSEIVDSIEDELLAISEGLANNDRLAYLTCLTDNEKTEYTKQEIKKLQAVFKVCSPDISEYIFALIQKHPYDSISRDEKQKQIIGNFILDCYSEAFDLIVKTSKEDTLFENTFREIVISSNFDPKLFDEIIIGIVNANRYLILTGLLDYAEKEVSISDDLHIINQQESKIPLPNENPHPRIFKNHDSFLFFESLKSDVRERSILADYSYIYRRMQNDGYIFKTILDAEFRDFLHATYSIDINKTKLLDYCRTDHKENLYRTKKSLFLNL